jgi:hypothetical protein
MTIEEFKKSLNQSHPPVLLSRNLEALWFDAKGNWEKAHNIVQETSGVDGDWIHAYLHRKEGDLSNASYWYSKVGKTRPAVSLDLEWEQLVNHLLNN